MCNGYRALNEIMVKNKYLIPLIINLFDCLQLGKIFFELDLHKIYYQVRVKEKDKSKMAITTMYGLFECKVMLFDLTNAPATFCTLMQEMLKICLINSLWYTSMILLCIVLTWRNVLYI